MTPKFRVWDAGRKRMWMHEGKTDDGQSLFLAVLPDGWALYEQLFGVQMCKNGNGNELMQWTGLKDRNEKEIYEGDVLQFTDLLEVQKTGIVIFYDGCSRLTQYINSFHPYEGNIKMWDDGSHDWYSMENLEQIDISIIGDRFQNPELLK